MNSSRSGRCWSLSWLSRVKTWKMGTTSRDRLYSEAIQTRLSPPLRQVSRG